MPQSGGKGACWPGPDKNQEARKLTSSREILLWMTPLEAPKALHFCGREGAQACARQDQAEAEEPACERPGGGVATLAAKRQAITLARNYPTKESWFHSLPSR